MALDRLTPTTGPKTGTAYATEIQEEVTGLWDRAVCTLTSVAGTNTITATLTPALTGSLLNGMLFILKPAATNTSTVTLNINGGGAVDVVDAEGTALIAGALRINASYLIRYDSGISKHVIVGYVPAATSSPMAVLLRSQSASASSSLDFVNGASGVVLDDTYDAYQLVLSNLRPATDDVELWLRVSTDSGSTYQTTLYDYAFRLQATGSGNDIGAAAASRIVLGQSSTGTNAVGNAAEETVSASIIFDNPENATFYKHFAFQVSYTSANATLFNGTGSGFWKATTAINAVRIMFESGNITSGRASLYGFKKA